MPVLTKDLQNMRHIRFGSFLFAGNDSTASMMVYVYHMLGENKDWLRKLRKEHDEVFGQDPTSAAGFLKENPSL